MDPTRKQRVELRAAALRRWEPADNLQSMARKLDVPEAWLWVSVRGLVRAVRDHYGTGKGAEAAADALELPVPFVKWAFRSIFMTKRATAKKHQRKETVAADRRAVEAERAERDQRVRDAYLARKGSK